MSPHNLHSLLLRPARRDDVEALARLAQLDSQRALDGQVIVAEAEGVLLAAVDADSGRTVADPFRPTRDVVDLLNAHAGRRRPLRRLALGRLRAAA